MSCELTERVSLLLDGELAAEEAGAVERHLALCAECREAHADFLSLRTQLNAYTATLDPQAARRALAEVLAAGRDAAPTAQGWRARLSGGFALPRFSPAYAGAFALLVVACALAFVVYRNTQSEPPSVARTTPSPVAQPASKPGPANANSAQPAPNTERNDGATQSATQTPTVAANSERARRRERAADVARATVNQSRVNVARNRGARSLPSELLPENSSVPQFVNANAAVGTNVARVRPADAETLTASHVEQSELLLRAFRNARLDAPGATDLAYERRRAHQLLYQNMVLRREAESEGNAQLAGLLDSLEPILLDIANLPPRAVVADVRAIQARMERKNLVALLQVNSATLARAYDD
jgi:hypothetical protein